MATKYLSRIAALAATLLAAAACIYPYEVVDFQQQSEMPLVVEGDIHIGNVTEVRLSYVQPLAPGEDYVYKAPVATGYIEGEDGTRIYQYDPYVQMPDYPIDGMDPIHYSIPSEVLTFHTEDLPTTQKYRLHLETFDLEKGSVSNTFESDWLSPAPAPTIDALTYSHHPDYEELWVGLSMHCHGSHYFRWTFSETWEYHSDISTLLEYKPTRGEVGYYEGPSLYYCWSTAKSSQINIFSTFNQIEDRFEELAFHTIPLSDKRLQVMYKIDVRLEAMSENAYNYWHNMQQNSEGQGSIFAPTPSEMASNIHCISDPTVQVMGYLNAAVQAEAVMYYDNGLEGYYKAGLPFERDNQKVDAHRPDSMAFWYSHGYRPYSEIYEDLSGKPSHYMWAKQICIDCRRQGGSKNKPEDWPTSHQ